MMYVSGQNIHAVNLVYHAFIRSCSFTQVKKVTTLNEKNIFCLTLIAPTNNEVALIKKILQIGGKVILFGTLPNDLLQELNGTVNELEKTVLKEASSVSAPIYSYTESLLKVVYHHTLDHFVHPIPERPFLHYDFRDEWNNLGFGRITMDASIWSLAQGVTFPDKHNLASVTINNKSICTYAAIFNEANGSLLWFNRAVGPIDSQEWRFIEYFIAHYRHKELITLPVLSEIPYGFDAAVTMRLDCDEDIKSASPLFTAYQKMNVPFSLAIHTALLNDAKHHKLIQAINRKGGAILSHSMTHPVNWGGSFPKALDEASSSKSAIKAVLKNKVPHYAVSPFHHTPPYALEALNNAGYKGCVGGIVSSDPEFLLARAGMVLSNNISFIGHSQSCMLHGDCLLKDKDPLKMYKKAFDIAFLGRAFFGFLDHPFSNRYSYGWENENARIKAHEDFIYYMRSKGNVLFLNENDALDFLYYKNNFELIVQEDKIFLTQRKKLAPVKNLLVLVEWRGGIKIISEEVILIHRPHA